MPDTFDPERDIPASTTDDVTTETFGTPTGEERELVVEKPSIGELRSFELAEQRGEFDDEFEMIDKLWEHIQEPDITTAAFDDLPPDEAGEWIDAITRAVMRACGASDDQIEQAVDDLQLTEGNGARSSRTRQRQHSR